jgi:hypothetical protein
MQPSSARSTAPRNHRTHSQSLGSTQKTAKIGPGNRPENGSRAYLPRPAKPFPFLEGGSRVSDVESGNRIGNQIRMINIINMA